MRLSDFNTTSTDEFQGNSYIVTADMILPLAESSIIGLSAPDDNYIVTLPDSVNDGVKVVIGNTGTTKIKIGINNNEYYVLLPEMVLNFVKKDALTWFVIKDCNDYPIVPENYTTKSLQILTSPVQVVSNVDITTSDIFNDTTHKILPFNDGKRYLLVTRNSSSSSTPYHTFYSYAYSEIMIFEYDEMMNIVSYTPLTISGSRIQIIDDNLIIATSGIYTVDSNNNIIYSASSSGSADDVILSESKDILIFVNYDPSNGDLIIDRYDFDISTNIMSNQSNVYSGTFLIRDSSHPSVDNVTNMSDYRNLQVKIKDRQYILCYQHFYYELRYWNGSQWKRGGWTTDYFMARMTFDNLYNNVNVDRLEPYGQITHSYSGSYSYNNFYKLERLTDRYVVIITKSDSYYRSQSQSGLYRKSKSMNIQLYDNINNSFYGINGMGIESHTNMSAGPFLSEIYIGNVRFFKVIVDPSNDDILWTFIYGKPQGLRVDPAPIEGLYITKKSFTNSFPEENSIIDIGNIPAGITNMFINNIYDDISFISHESVQYIMNNVKIFKG